LNFEFVALKGCVFADNVALHFNKKVINAEIESFADTESLVKIIPPDLVKDKTIFLEFYEKLESSYNQRLLVYSKCELNFKGLMPGKGTVAFAMSYYMHQLMNKKPLNNEFDILTGNSDINQNDMESLPEITEVMKNHIELITSIMESQIDKHVRNINGLFEK